MRFVFAAFLFVFFIPASVEAKAAAVVSVHQEALLIVKTHSPPPPLVAWAFAKANLAANTAFLESRGSEISYQAAFLETWALLIGNKKLPANLSNSNQEQVAIGTEVAHREWKRSERELRAAKEKTWRSPDSIGEGIWRPTPPDFDQPLLPNWEKMNLFGSSSVKAITLGLHPPELASPEAIQDLKEVMQIGSAHSKDRTSDQSLIATFWAAGPKTVTPPGMWIEIALDRIEQENLGEPEARQLMHAISMAMANAGIACWDLKFKTLVWRPIAAAQDLQKEWQPYITTPPFPSYVSGHSSFSGAAATVLGELLGQKKSFTVKSHVHPGVVRNFQSFWAAAEEAGQSRIYGGIHFQFDNIDGLELGRRSACLVLKDLGLRDCR